MKIDTLGKELYPVSLLVALFMLWGLAGVAEAPYVAPPAAWMEARPAEELGRFCKEERIGFSASAFCKYSKEEQPGSSIFEHTKIRSPLYSRLEREITTKKQ